MFRTLTLLAALVAALPCPADETADRALDTIAFGSCAEQDRPLPIWDAIVATEPDLFLFLGDNIYADTDDMAVMRQKYAKLGAMEGYQKLKSRCEIMAVWDDHDYGRNDAGENYPMRDASQKELLDFFGVPEDSYRRDRKGVYHAKVFGPEGRRVQVILLDTRYFRSDLKRARRGDGRMIYVPNRDEGATMLGEGQWAWLGEQLREPAELRIIGSSVQVVPEDHIWEKWMNIPAERERLFRLIQDTAAEGVVFLSGDRHHAELSMMNAGVGYPIYDLTSSGLNQGWKNWQPLEVNRHRVATMSYGNNFGLIEIDWEKPDPVVSLQVRNEDGDVTIRQDVKVSVLRRGALPGGPALGPPTVIEGVLSLEEAAGKSNAICTVEMEVKSTGGTQDGNVIYLNSKENFRDPDNFTVRLMARELKDGIEGLDRDTFAGKTVRVTGLIERTDFGPRVTVTDASKIQAIGE